MHIINKLLASFCLLLPTLLLAEMIEKTTTFQFSIADNAFYAQKLAPIILKQKLSEEFVAQLNKQDHILLATKNLTANNIKAIVSCNTGIVYESYIKNQSLLGKVTWQYDLTKVIYDLIKTGYRDDVVFLLSTIYSYQKQNIDKIANLRQQLFATTDEQEKIKLVPLYQQQLDKVVSNTAVQKMCTSILDKYSDPQNDLKAWQDVHKLQPNWSIARYYLAKQQYKHNDIKQALQTLNPLLSKSQDGIDNNQAILGLYQLLHGDLAKANNDSESAFTAWKQALNQPQGFSYVYEQLATRFAKNTPEYLQTLKKNMEVRPNHKTLYALAQAEEDKTSESYGNYLMQTIDLNPEFVPAYIDLSAWHEKKQNHEKALHFMHIISSLEPSKANWLIALGRLYSKENDITKSLFYYQQAMLLDTSAEVKQQVTNALNNK